MVLHGAAHFRRVLVLNGQEQARAVGMGYAHSVDE